MHETLWYIDMLSILISFVIYFTEVFFILNHDVNVGNVMQVPRKKYWYKRNQETKILNNFFSRSQYHEN